MGWFKKLFAKRHQSSDPSTVTNQTIPIKGIKMYGKMGIGVVIDVNDNICGLWVKNPEDTQLNNSSKLRLQMFVGWHKLPEHVFEAIALGNFQVRSNSSKNGGEYLLLIPESTNKGC